MDNNTVESIVQAVLAQLAADGVKTDEQTVKQTVTSYVDNTPDSELVDITSKEVKAIPLIKNPADPEGLARMMKRTPAS